jgi:hypothetical protein
LIERAAMFRVCERISERFESGEPANAVWLLPMRAFRAAVIASRGGAASGFLPKTTDPENALRNLLERDHLFTEALREEAARLKVRAIEVDATSTEDDLAERVSETFGLC